MRQLCIFAPAVLGTLGLLNSDTVVAQTRGGMTAGRSYGQTSRGQGSFGQGSRGAFGSPVGRGQSRGGAGYGTNAFGQPGAGFGGGFGAGGLGGTARQTLGPNQFGAGADTFLGSDAQQTQDFFRALGGGQRRAASFDTMIENLNEQRNRRGRGNNQDRTPPVRVQLRPAFDTPLGTMGRVSTNVKSRLASAAVELGITDLAASMDGRTLVLKGKVTSPHQRDLAEQMMLLEPGISGVDNRLVVEPE